MAAQQGSLSLLSLKTGRTYNVDIHLPDAASTYWTFNSTGPATSTSSNQYRLPEDVQIYDFSLTTSPTATNVTFQVDNAPVNGGVIRYANQLTSLPNRQRLNIKLPQGALLQGFQNA